MYCQNCNKQINDDAKFCPQCGTRLTDVSSDTLSFDNKLLKSKKSSGLKKIAIVTLVFILSVGVGIGVAYNNRAKNIVNDTKTAMETPFNNAKSDIPSVSKNTSKETVRQYPAQDRRYEHSSLDNNEDKIRNDERMFKVDSKKFNEIKMGTSYNDVKAVMGENGKLSQQNDTDKKSYEWQDAASNIKCIFFDNQLVYKNMISSSAGISKTSDGKVKLDAQSPSDDTNDNISL